MPVIGIVERIFYTLNPYLTRRWTCPQPRCLPSPSPCFLGLPESAAAVGASRSTTSTGASLAAALPRPLLFFSISRTGGSQRPTPLPPPVLPWLQRRTIPCSSSPSAGPTAAMGNRGGSWRHGRERLGVGAEEEGGGTGDRERQTRSWPALPSSRWPPSSPLQLLPLPRRGGRASPHRFLSAPPSSPRLRPHPQLQQEGRRKGARRSKGRGRPATPGGAARGSPAATRAEDERLRRDGSWRERSRGAGERK